jgi:hypothetical protein
MLRLGRPAFADKGVMEWWSAGGMERKRGIILLHCSSTPLSLVLCLITETLFVPALPHALAALVFGNFRFASFLERAHSDFQICECRFNHLIRRVATQFFATVGRTAMPGRRSAPSLPRSTSNRQELDRIFRTKSIISSASHLVLP